PNSWGTRRRTVIISLSGSLRFEASRRQCTGGFMTGAGKNQEQLLEELEALRARLAELEGATGQPVEEPLRGSQRFLALVLVHAPLSVSVISADGRYLLVNRAWEDLFQVRREVALGQPAEQVVPLETARRFGVIHRQVLETGVAMTIEKFEDAPNGRRFYHT